MVERVRREWEPNDLVELNVGGTHFTTTVHTLAGDGRSEYWRSMLSGEHNVTLDRNGAVFVDRDGSRFRHVLNFLRDGSIGVPEGDVVALRELLCEAQYYGVHDLERDLTLKLEHAERRRALQEQRWEEDVHSDMYPKNHYVMLAPPRMLSIEHHAPAAMLAPGATVSEASSASHQWQEISNAHSNSSAPDITIATGSAVHSTAVAGPSQLSTSRHTQVPHNQFQLDAEF